MRRFDVMGAEIGIHRHRGLLLRESDASYWRRILAAMTPLRVGTTEAIVSTVLNAAWVRSVRVLSVPGRAVVVAKTPLWHRLLIFPARVDRKRITKALKGSLAVGVQLEVRLR